MEGYDRAPHLLLFLRTALPSICVEMFLIQIESKASCGCQCPFLISDKTYQSCICFESCWTRAYQESTGILCFGVIANIQASGMSRNSRHMCCVYLLCPILMLHCHIWLCLQDEGWQWQSVKPSSGPFSPRGAVWLQRSRFYSTLSTAIAHAIPGFCMVNSTKLSWGFQLCSLHSWSSTVSYFSRSFTPLSCSAFYTKYLIIQLSILKLFNSSGAFRTKSNLCTKTLQTFMIRPFSPL